MSLHDVVKRIENLRALDPVADRLADAAHEVIPDGQVKDALSGSWLGHPLHPMLTDIPIGCFSSAAVIDVIGGRRGRKAADKLVLLGLASAVPTAASGWADWSETVGEARRIGVVHAAANVVGLACYAASYVNRKRGRRLRGVLQGFAGMGAMSVGGYLGGHLVFAKGIGVNATHDEEGVADWASAAPLAEVPERRPIGVDVNGTRVVLYRQGHQIDALSATCTHAGGPLDEGEVEDGCIRCPWHGSVFELRTGKVVHGPATVPEPVYDARIVGDKVEVRLR
jgi:nitrite reductase/ring-hydroxylating ferredoxin subunit/uncharacterized membrane protein